MMERRPGPVIDRDLLRLLNDSETTIVGWGAGRLLHELSELYPVRLSYLIDSDKQLQGTRVSSMEGDDLEVFAPEKLSQEQGDRVLVIIYTSAHSAVSRQLEKLGTIRSVPAEDLLAYPLLPSHRAWAEEFPAEACLRALAKTVIAPILALRPGDDFVLCGAGESAQVVADMCLSRDRHPMAVLDDAAAPGQIRSIPILPIDEGIQSCYPQTVIYANVSSGDERRDQVRTSLDSRKGERVRLALKDWSRSCEALDESGLHGTERHVRWTQEREKLWLAAGPFPSPAKDQKRMRSLHNRYRGERIFVLANGPSLNQQDLGKLEGEFTFGFNKIYLLFERVSWRPTFYTTIDWRVTPDMVEDINRLEQSTLFVPEPFRGMIHGGRDCYHFPLHNTLPAGWRSVEDRFAFDVNQGVWRGATVVVVGLQLAFYMGFDPIILIGADLNYKIAKTVRNEGLGHYRGTESRNLLSTADDDTAHFDPRYFGAGSRWHEPAMDGMRSGFRNCLDAAESRGRTILNATAGGELEVFERVDYDSLFEAGPGRRGASGILTGSSPVG